MARTQPVKSSDDVNTILGVEIAGPLLLNLAWSNGSEAEIDLSTTAALEPFRSLNESLVFEAVEIGDWGHSLVWPGGVELGADALWLDTLAATGRDDARTFLTWRLRHGLTIQAAALALAVSEREVARYSNARTPVPKTILLACRGWEALQAA